MNNYNKLYNLIEKLKDKISKLDNKSHKNSKNNYLHKNNMNNMNNMNNINNNKNIFLSYNISSPTTCNQNKKFIGLLFNSFVNDDSSNCENNCKNNCDSSDFSSFIKLKKGIYIINYSIYLDINNKTTDSCSFSLGIKEKHNSKIRIIKGSKNIVVIDIVNKFIVNTTILYSSQDDDELCLIAELNNKIKINSKKSIIKILMIN